MDECRGLTCDFLSFKRILSNIVFMDSNKALRTLTETMLLGYSAEFKTFL